MSFALLIFVLVIIALYLVAGVLRYLRQEFQPPRDTDDEVKRGPRSG